MFFFLFSFCFNLEEITKQLPHDIDIFEYKAEENASITILTPRRYDFVITLLAKSGDVQIQYAYPVGTAPIQYNTTALAYRFLQGDAEIKLFMPTGSYIKFAYATLLRGQCETLEVNTKSPYTYEMTATGKVQNHCIFFSPMKSNVNYIINFNVTGASLTPIISVYHEEMIHNILYTSFSAGKAGNSSITPSDRPFLFKFSTGLDQRGDMSVELTEGNELSQFSLQEYQVTPINVAGAALGHLPTNYWLPIIGCAPAALLLVSWIYGYSRVMKKKPVDAPYFNN